MKPFLCAAALAMAAPAALADQCAWISGAAASKALQILKPGMTVLHFCEPCGDKEPGKPFKVLTVMSTPKGGGLAEISINGAEEDLAYLFIYMSKHKTFENAAHLTGCPAEGDAISEEELGEAQRPSRPRSGHGGQTFREYLTGARGMVTEKLAHAELQAHSVGAPRQISQGPCIPAVDACGLSVAERAGNRGLGRGHVERDLGGSIIDVPRLQRQRRLIWQEAGKESQNRCRNESGVLLR